MNQNSLPEMHNPPPPPPLTMEGMLWQAFYNTEIVKARYERQKEIGRLGFNAFVIGFCIASVFWWAVAFLIAHK